MDPAASGVTSTQLDSTQVAIPEDAQVTDRTGQSKVASRTAERDTRPVSVRLTRFVIERYPPVPQVILVALLWASGISMAVTMWAPAAGALPGAADPVKLALSFAGGLLFVFHLRVFDDVKDADTDRIIEPTRPIPRGLVSEREVDLLSVGLIAIEAVVFGLIGGLAFAVWAIAAAFTVLMRVEFFVGEWLEQHVLTYAISHMVAMGLVLASLVAAGIDATGMSGSVGIGDVINSWQLALACVAAIVLGLGFELGRKFERYAEAHGLTAWLLLAACPTTALAMFAIAARGSYPTWTIITLWACTVACLVGHVVLVARRPRPETSPSLIGPKMRETVEALPGVAGLAAYLVLAIAGIQALEL